MSPRSTQRGRRQGTDKVPSEDKGKVYLGIDPGIDGGMAALCLDGKVLGLVRMPKTRGDILEWLREQGGGHRGKIEESPAPLFALIEQQTPRPTMVFDHELKQVRPRILKSTCLLYGFFTELCMALLALGIPYEECPPKRWQKGLNVPDKDKGEDKNSWKRRLKGKAQQLFPKEKVTLYNCDALLIAEYARRKDRGK